MVLDQGNSQDPIFLGQKGDSPHHQYMLRSQLYLPHNMQLINTGYYVDDLPNQEIDSYLRFDTQLIWTATNNMEISVVGQNLLDNRHPEFGGSTSGPQNDIQRSVYGRLILRY